MIRYETPSLIVQTAHARCFVARTCASVTEPAASLRLRLRLSLRLRRRSPRMSRLGSTVREEIEIPQAVQDLPRRNAVAVEQALRQASRAIEEQNKRINGLNDALSSVYNRLNAVEAKLAIHQASAVGRGPTVKE
jgi:hypothetical protein